MTPSELRAKIEAANPDSKYFSRENMRFAGDSMKNFGVRSVTVVCDYTATGEYKPGDGQVIEVWELYRKNSTPKRFPAGTVSYWRKDTFLQVHCAKPK